MRIQLKRNEQSEAPHIDLVILNRSVTLGLVELLSITGSRHASLIVDILQESPISLKIDGRISITHARYVLDRLIDPCLQLYFVVNA